MACEAMIKREPDIKDGLTVASYYYNRELRERGIYDANSPSVEYLNGWKDCVEHYWLQISGAEK